MFNYTNHISSLQLVSLLCAHRISHIVVCPGSRNAPLVHDMAEVGMTLHEVTDERSAGFFANGLIQALGTPVAVCVTSGSALLNVAPAVAEAYYQQLPLLVISADRPAAWIGQADGQTMPQPSAFGSMVVRCVSLPEGDGNEQRWHRNRLINEAILAMKVRQRPVHINVPLSEPLFTFSIKELPLERVISYCQPQPMAEGLYLELFPEWRLYKRRMIIVGQLPPGVLREFFSPQRLKMFVRAGIVVLYEQLSNLQVHIGAGSQSCVTTFDDILSHCNESQLRLMVPDLLITLGGHIVSKRFKRFLRDNPPRRHWHVTDSIDQLPDLFQCVTRFVEAKPRNILDFVCTAAKNSETYTETCVGEFLDSWMLNHEFIQDMNTRNPAPSPEATVLRALGEQLTKSWHLQVANSSMVRNLQRFLPELRNVVRCNRGINGIEGSVSTAVGYRAAGEPTLLLIGDLSFFYDQNGLWNASLHDERNKAPLRILLINNGGGAIFHHLPGLDASPYRDRYVAAAHHTSAQGIAQQSGIAYRSLDNLSCSSMLTNALAWLLDTTKKQSKVALLEILIPEASGNK